MINSKKVLTLVVGAMSYSLALAYDFIDNGIYYTVISEPDKKVEVSAPKQKTEYAGDFVIPAQVTNNGVTYTVTQIGKQAFLNTKITSLEMPNTLEVIQSSGVSSCQELRHVTLPNSVKTIYDRAFYHCRNLKSVVFGTGLTGIGANAFYEGTDYGTMQPISALQKVTFLCSSVPTGIPTGINCSSTVNIVPNKNYLNAKGISNNKEYTQVFEYLSSYFDVDGLRYVPVSAPDRTCAIIDCTYDRNVKSMKVGPTVQYRGMDMSVVAIANRALAFNEYVESIEIDVPGPLSWQIARDCPNLNKVVVSENVTDLSYMSFANGFQNTTAGTVMLNNKGKMGDRVFEKCIGLKDVQMTVGVTSVDDNAFNGCISIESMSLPSTIAVIGNNAFDGATSLKEIRLSKQLTKIGLNCFANSGLEHLSIPPSVVEIGNGAFTKCASLTSLVFEDGEQDIKIGTYPAKGYGMFHDCPLTEVVIGRQITYDTKNTYGYSPFCKMATIESVTFTSQPNYIGTGMFEGCTGIKVLKTGNGIQYLYDNAFKGCTSIQEVWLGKKVSSLGAACFQGCTVIKDLYSANEEPPSCVSSALTDLNLFDCMIHVPANAVEAYKQTEPWKNFWFIEGYEFPDDQEVSNDDLISIDVTPKLAGFDLTFDTHDAAWSNFKVWIGDKEFEQNEDGVYIMRDLLPATEYTIEYSIDVAGKHVYDGFNMSTFTPDIAREYLFCNPRYAEIQFTATSDETLKPDKYTLEIAHNFLMEYSQIRKYTDYVFVEENETGYFIYDKKIPQMGSEDPDHADSYKYDLGFTYPFKITAWYGENSFSVEFLHNGGYISPNLNYGKNKIGITKFSLQEASFGYGMSGEGISANNSQAGLEQTDLGLLDEGYYNGRNYVKFPYERYNLEPNTEYTIKYGVRVNGEGLGYCSAKGVPQWYDKNFGTTWQPNCLTTYKDIKIKTKALSMTTEDPVLTSKTSARFRSATNCDANTNVGFQWLRTDAPSSANPTFEPCEIINGEMIGTLRGLDPTAYYKYRAVYIASSGKEFGGPWKSFTTADANVYFEPEIKTYDTAEVDGTSVTLYGYSLEGTDEIISQGFEYWQETASRADEVIRIEVSGLNMYIKLDGLEPNHRYHYRAYAETQNGVTYGNEYTFIIGILPAGIESVLADSTEGIIAKLKGNPVHDVALISVESKMAHADYTIYNLSGKLYGAGIVDCNCSWQPINVSDYDRGIYVIVITDGIDRKSLKLDIR